MRKPFQQDRIPKFYFYKMTVDDGGAPCVQDGLPTLASCKPSMRRTAPEGSVIIGFAGSCLKGEGYDDNPIVYAAVVSSRLTDGEYYSKRKYACRPDCIYKRTGERFARQAKAMFHEGAGHLEHDLGAPPHYDNAIVLLSEGAENFKYFGSQCQCSTRRCSRALGKKSRASRKGIGSITMHGYMRNFRD